jgi:hypothetical protein
MSSSPSDKKADEQKYAYIRQSLIDQHRTTINKTVMNFIMTEIIDRSGDSVALDAAFHVDKMPIVVEALREVIAMLEKMADPDKISTTT